ncbi:MAG: 3-dehydroquinate synthase [Gammaproteobacteria bacterium]|nr:3-dehydroquinate synthase [Gammaproteobacteria bacterium]NNM14270.1 3-dehydroquinate synthase [Gammaproteobacteria bacterium]
MPDNSNIILVGPMGAGKSAVGKLLASRLSRQFHDTDHNIVARTGVDISYIFEKEGEEGFRKRETEVIGQLCSKSNVLISTGGGSVVKPENRKIIAESGYVIYLHASVAQQARRTKKKDNRPLLRSDDPKKILARLMQEREFLYRDVADLVIQTDGQKVPKVVESILNAMEKVNTKKPDSSQTNISVSTKSRKYNATVINCEFEDDQALAKLAAEPLVVVTDENLDKVYREKIEPLLNPAAWLVVPASESSKSFDHYQWLLNELLALGVKRDTTLVGLGGGVVGDLTGFVAATFMRGMRLVHIPTSLLAMVDSSIGGKTGINMPQGKNLIGSIYQPFGVLCNLRFLKTLPEREYISGLAEVVKYGLIYDIDLLELLEQNCDSIRMRDLAVLSKIVQRCIAIKAEIVEKDEQDHGLRMLLNFGHTFGHAIEALQEYSGFKHGEAVAIGMCMAADLSSELGHLKQSELSRVKRIISSLGLPTAWNEFNIQNFISLTKGDKKNTSDTQRFILLKALGEAYIDESVSNVQLKKILSQYKEQNTTHRQSA